MIVVIDTNVFMAGLLKDSIVRQILFFNNIKFFLPENAISEINKYKGDLIKRGNYTENEFNKLFGLLLERVILVQKETISPFVKKSKEIMKDIDIDDSTFIATALAINADGIWTFDKHFKQQAKVKVISTKDLIKTLD